MDKKSKKHERGTRTMNDTIEVGQALYNPNGYFALTVQSIDGDKVTMYSPDDSRDFPRVLTVEYIQTNWVRLSNG